ncbi:type II secretion system F family protein [Heyndrickxia sp. NPDC080065]|uniref:type II secretion system F family protein n=1 Tax=Heyndrickxia sp. NPDC080065 TaxID=3390568 RepID=UPI003CFD415A
MESAILFGVSVLFFIWGLYNYLGFRKDKREVKKQYENFFKKKERNSFIVKLGDRFDQTSSAESIKRKLVQANISILPSEFIAILLLCAFALTMLLTVIFSLPLVLSMITSVIVCILSYWFLLIFKKNKQVEKLNNQLSEVCRLLANSTRAGMTINQGLEVVAAEMDSPAKEEFKELTHNLRLGVNFESALKSLEKRIETREFKLFVSALLIQKRSGGNLTKVLEEMSKTLEERKILRQTIKTSTAEQRFVSYILPAMPIVLILMLNTMMDGFLDPIFTIPGAILMIIFIIGMIIAFLLVKAVTNIKV